MTEDARFEDGADRPLRLRALDADDLPILAALAQDAVFPASEMHWDRNSRRFAILLNRFRWEDDRALHLGNRPVERVQSVLSIEFVERVSSQGIQPGDPDMVHSLLSIDFAPGDAPAGTLDLTFAGDGAVRIAVEALEVTLTDVTRPYAAPSKKIPSHPE